MHITVPMLIFQVSVVYTLWTVPQNFPSKCYPRRLMTLGLWIRFVPCVGSNLSGTRKWTLYWQPPPEVFVCENESTDCRCRGLAITQPRWYWQMSSVRKEIHVLLTRKTLRRLCWKKPSNNLDRRLVLCFIGGLIITNCFYELRLIFETQRQ